jgi:hypothetical protein
MENSKLPFRYWFVTMHLLTATKNTFSALELQRQLGHKRYQPVWEMLHKLRSVMGKRDGKYTLKGNVEIDEGFFSTEVKEEEKDDAPKRGAGSQSKTKVLVWGGKRVRRKSETRQEGEEGQPHQDGRHPGCEGGHDRWRGEGEGRQGFVRGGRRHEIARSFPGHLQGVFRT